MKRTFLTLILCASFSIGMMAQHSIGRAPHSTHTPPSGSINAAPVGFGIMYDAYNEVFASTAASDFSSITTFLNAPNTDFFAGDKGPSNRYFVADYSSNTLHEVDFNTNTVNLIGSLTGILPGQSVTGMTYHSGSDIMYFSTTDISTSNLYTLNLNTGALTIIGQITNCPGVIDIAINSTGHLYGIDIVNDNLVEINTANGAGTIVGSLGLDVSFAQDIDFDDNTGELYWAAYLIPTEGCIRKINTANASSTVVIASASEIDCLAIGDTSSAVPVNKWAILSIFVLLMGVVSLRFFFRK